MQQTHDARREVKERARAVSPQRTRRRRRERAQARAPSSMRSCMTIDTQKMISSIHGGVIVESINNEEVELYLGFGVTGTGGVGICSSSFNASICARGAFNVARVSV